MLVKNAKIAIVACSNAQTLCNKEKVNVLEEVNNESYRFSMLETRLTSRKIFCEQVNKMFGLNIDVELREDLQLAQANKYTEDMNDKEGGVVNE